ncbi:MAG: alanine--tRNA ligase [Acidobacteriota bacterium]
MKSTWETDLFQPLIQEATRLTGAEYDPDGPSGVSLRILADHSRACAFLINDGVIPGNEGRGYVLRKTLRRAIRHGKMLGCKDPFLYTLTALVCHSMKAFPELEESREYAARIVRSEEEKFSATLDLGLSRLEEICESAAGRGDQQLPGSELFRLYDTYGFPLDLAQEIAQEHGFGIDRQGFDAEMQKQKKRARASWKGAAKAAQPLYKSLADRGLSSEFTGYQETESVPGKVIALIQEGQELPSLQEGQKGEAVLDRTPFYAESGGQVADRGRMVHDGGQAAVTDVFSPVGELRLHKIEVQSGRLSVGDEVTSSILEAPRRATQRNHTATHLFHAALREVLGPHVKQAGSLVAPDRLRFDFTHYKQVTALELREIEEIVNRKIRRNVAVQTDLCDLDEAIERGAMALFGEKYQQQVRVVQVPGFSLELCGGTHVQRTGDIGIFHITAESSISAGVRRVEAVTGEGALGHLLANVDLVERLTGQLNTRPDNLSESVERMAGQLKKANRQVEKLQLKLAQAESGDARSQARHINGIAVVSQQVEKLDRNALRQLADQMRNQLGSGVVVLGTPSNGRVSLVAMVSKDLTDRIQAGALIREVAQLVEGGGGGKPEMAEAGGKDASKLPEALEHVYRFVSEKTS